MMGTSQADVFAVANGALSYGSSHQNILASYTHVMRGGFGCGGPMDLFCYDAVAGRGDVYTTDPKNNLLSLVTSYPSLRKWCSQVVVGNFGSSGYEDLLFYQPSTGTIDIYQVNQGGRLYLLKTVTGVRTSWTSIVAGRFGSESWADLFCYDAATGLGEFQVTDGLGTLTVAAQHTALRKGCTHVVVGSFGGSTYDDLLFYEPTGGTGDFYAVDKVGRLTHLHTHPSWRKTWTTIVAGNFGGDAWTDLMLIDSTVNEMEVFAANGKGGAINLSAYGQVPAWTHLVSGRFRTPAGANDDVLGYYQTEGLDAVWPALPAPAPVTPPPPLEVKGRGEIYAIEGGKLRLVATHKAMSKSWTHVVAGNFGGPNADLFFYDTATGRAQIMGMDKDGKLTSLRNFPDKFFPPGYRKIVAMPGSGYTSLACYFFGNGTIDIFKVDGPGQLSKLKTSDTWSKTWNEMAAGYFDANGTGDLVVYDAAAGRLSFYAQDNAGALSQLKSNTGCSKSWTRIVPGMFAGSGPQTTHLLSYDATNGIGQLWKTDGKGGISAMGAAMTFRSTWSQIVPGNGGSSTSVPLIFYDASRAEVALYSVTSQGAIGAIGSQTGMPKDWTQIAARAMWTAGYNVYLFCYSPTGG